jgi:hypothetical protein
MKDDDDNKRLVIACSSPKMSCELTLLALKLDEELLHSSFASWTFCIYSWTKSCENSAKVMVCHLDEPIGARRDRIMRGRPMSLRIGLRIWCVLSFVCSQELSNKVSKLWQTNMLDLMMISDWEIHCTRDQVDKLSPSGSVVSCTDTSWRVPHSHFFGVILDLLGSEAFIGICVHLTLPDPDLN